MNVQFTGVEEFSAMLDKKGKPHMQKVVKKYGAKLQSGAMKKAPVRTGFLKQHIQPPEITDDGLTAKVVSSADYSAYLEYGTRKQHAKPFMKPALDELSNDFVKELLE